MAVGVTAERRPVARGDAVALTQALVRIDSRNPSLAADGPGEAEVATALGKVLEDWGFESRYPKQRRGDPI